MVNSNASINKKYLSKGLVSEQLKCISTKKNIFSMEKIKIVQTRLFC